MVLTLKARQLYLQRERVGPVVNVFFFFLFFAFHLIKALQE